MKKFIRFLMIVLLICAGVVAYQFVIRFINENRILRQVITRLEADSRIAEVLVTDVHYNEETGKKSTTIKFLEYDTKQRPLKAKYFTFPGNIIQFQSLVVRFDDLYIRNNAALRGKSAYIFWKVFMLDGKNTVEYEITKIDAIPQGYKIDNLNHPFEEKLWSKFWDYALNPQEAKRIGVKNAQIEAPGTMFIPGTFYTIKIEHDGGIRIDAQPLPEILKGEKIPES